MTGATPLASQTRPLARPSGRFSRPRGKWYYLHLFLAVILSGKLILVGWIIFGSARPFPASAQAQTAAPAKPQAPDAQAQPKAEPAEKKDAQPSPIQMEMLKQIEAERQKLEAREKALEVKAQELGALKKDVDDKLATLEKLNKAIEAQKSQEALQREEQLKKLVQLYMNMKPAAAAAIIEKLDLKTTVEIFQRMRGREAGRIMAAIKPERATEITKLLSQTLPGTPTPQRPGRPAD